MPETFGIENKKYSYSWGILNNIKLRIETAFDAHSIAIDSQKNYVNSIRTAFEQKVNADVAKQSLTDSDYGQYYSQMYSAQEAIMDDLYRQQTYSSCQALHSLFETSLKEISEELAKSFIVVLKIEDLKAENDLQRFWKYLTKVQQLEIESLSATFENICVQKKLRNAIAHHYGCVKANDVKFLKHNTTVDFKPYGDGYRIEIPDVNYLHSLASQMQSFLNQLLNELDKFYDKNVV